MPTCVSFTARVCRCVGVQAGDILGCAADLDSKTIQFSLNGSFAPPMGIPPHGQNMDFVGGLCPGLTLQVRL